MRVFWALEGRARGLQFTARASDVENGGLNGTAQNGAHPPPTVEPGGSVLDAVGVMTRDRVGAVAVVEMGVLKGIHGARPHVQRCLCAASRSCFWPLS